MTEDHNDRTDRDEHTGRGAHDDRDDHTDRDPVEFGAGTPPLEWAMAVLGALIVGALLAVLVIDGITAPSGPPAPEATVASTVQQGPRTLLLVEVTNTGGRSAEAVVVRAEAGGSDVAQATVDHLPRGATETVGLLLGPDVDPSAATVRVTGFRQP